MEITDEKESSEAGGHDGAGGEILEAARRLEREKGKRKSQGKMGQSPKKRSDDGVWEATSRLSKAGGHQWWDDGSRGARR